MLRVRKNTGMLGRVMFSQRKPSEASGIRSSMRRGSKRTSPTDVLLSLHNAFVHFFFVELQTNPRVQRLVSSSYHHIKRGKVERVSMDCTALIQK